MAELGRRNNGGRYDKKQGSQGLIAMKSRQGRKCSNADLIPRHLF